MAINFVADGSSEVFVTSLAKHLAGPSATISCIDPGF
jgi:hypothetical protein